MSRFYRGKKSHPLRNILCSLAVFLGLVSLFSYGLDSLSEKARAEQKKSLEQAIWRGITQCYAVEGRYPEDLAYLRKEYGLQYDSDTFFVDYQVPGANIMPDVTIIER